MKNKKQIIFSFLTAAAMANMFFAAPTESPLTIKADAIKFRVHEQQNLGDDGEYYGGSDEEFYDFTEWYTSSLSDNIEIRWDERDLNLIDYYERVPYKLAHRERYGYRLLSNGKWKKTRLYYSDSSIHGLIYYKINGLKPSTKYTFKLLTRLKRYPDVKFVVKFSTMTCPEKIEKITGHASTTAVRLNWKKVKCSGYEIEQYSPKDKYWKTVKRVNKNSTSVRISGLESGTKYKFRIMPYSKLNNTKLYKGGKWVKGSKLYHADPSKALTLVTKE